jgi:urea carboxylase
MCVYGMEGPGGYQFVGRTVQMWNTYAERTPWLLRTFDQIRFHPVSADELLEIRDVFPHGGYSLDIEHQDFRLKDYHAFLASIHDEIPIYKQRQQQAFDEERERWGAEQFADTPDNVAPMAEDAVPGGCRAVSSPVTASVWSIAVEPGQRVAVGQRLIVLEAMKMEIAVTAPVAGVVEKLHCTLGALVSAGQRLITIRI